MIIEQINNSYLGYNDDHDIHTKEYYDYCVSLLKKRLGEVYLELNVIFGDYDINFSNTHRTIKIDIQCEHTLVKVGGRSVSEIIYSGLEPVNDDMYLIRIDKYDYLKKLDGVVDYSLMNINNINSKLEFSDFIKKTCYVSPLLYEINFDNDNKTDIITLFSNNSPQRRTNIQNELTKLDIFYHNINNCFSKQQLLTLYNTTKIMVNVHQTDHHRTFEELRVLPALLNGVLIISEEVPYKEFIPYHEYIIWVKYDDIIAMTNQVSNNYNLFYETIFNRGELRNILNDMSDNNNTAFDKLIK